MLKRILTISFLLVGCSRSAFDTPTTTNDQNTAQDVRAPAPGIEVAVATPVQCAAGGQVYTIFADENQNGLRDPGEGALNEQVLCHGVNGTDGAQGATGAPGTNGTNGVDGAHGSNGSNGVSVVFSVLPAPTSDCAAGGSTILMSQDTDQSGTVTVNDSSIQTTTICNGIAGAPASVPMMATVDAIVACGNTSPYKEVLLRLQNGQVLASFSNNSSGDMTRLAFLTDGTFQNTDNSGCIFTLSTSADGTTRSISWSGQVQSTWSMF